MENLPKRTGCYHILRVIKIFTLLSAIFICLIIISFFNLLATRHEERQQNCGTYLSTPISQDIAKNLCERGLIPAYLANCNTNEIQLFRNDIDTIIKANVRIGRSTYTDTTALFSEYEGYCPLIEKDRSSEYTCDYDISKSGPITRIFYNSKTDVVQSLFTVSCN